MLGAYSVREVKGLFSHWQHISLPVTIERSGTNMDQNTNVPRVQMPQLPRISVHVTT
jgi:hypothetical protein